MQIVRCAACRMMYQNPRVAEAEMPDAYEVIGGYQRFAAQDEAKRELFRARIRRFQGECHLPSQGGFLDVGASRGIMLDCVGELLPGWRLRAVELSPSARVELSQRGHGSAASVDELDAGEKFDWINIDNVLEHLPDPVGALADLKSRLNPGGFIYVEVPNESFLVLRYRVNDRVRGFGKLPTAEGHINLFTPRTLHRAIRAAGLECDRFWLESVAVPHRLKGALGADETQAIGRVLEFLRFTRLDVALRLAYFACARIRVG